ncbi:MAG: flavodoxin family protein [Candidatus Gastranaerophilales bacterium]|nr:flavodoxin family protein [Candidatus Gastranaerophilales bacterium]
MDKVILLSGSPRQGSNCEIALNECKKVIESEGLEAKILTLKGKNIRSCVACGMCSELKRCVYNDDGINDIIAELREAKGLIIAAPVYFGTARGDMMSALQRIGYVSRHTDNFLSWKVGGPIVIGRRGGHTATYQEMLMFYFINEMVVPGANYWNILFAGPQGSVVKDEEGINTIKIFSSNVSKLIKKL